MDGDDGFDGGLDGGEDHFTAESVIDESIPKDGHVHGPNCNHGPGLRYNPTVASEEEQVAGGDDGKKKKPKKPAKYASAANAEEHVHGPGCNHNETKKSGFLEKISEELKTTRGKVIAFGAVAAVAVGAYMLMNQQEQSFTR